MRGSKKMFSAIAALFAFVILFSVEGRAQADNVVPNITQKSPDGKTSYDLYKVMKEHKLTLIDFWASWCPPCRAENPHVVATYNKFKNDGFTIYSVSLDKKVDRWKKAIAKDKLTWKYHVSDLQGWSNSAAEKYGVRSIPANFLINSKGEVLAYNLRGHDLEKAVEKFLKASK